ncbi:hypothetical protein AVEN_148039-1 [Araneus ventricosus]|uniref:Uncharacterized protein n=1 Tax=Araneus ventricosus TaxID=182803 RepID=A0A4Y2PCG7_ARAVE|nr:hypothetical protein AVEN_148039-1 [Araneus ventricosus]
MREKSYLIGNNQSTLMPSIRAHCNRHVQNLRCKIKHKITQNNHTFIKALLSNTRKEATDQFLWQPQPMLTSDATQFSDSGRISEANDKFAGREGALPRTS